LTITEREGRFTCHVPKLPLSPGRYRVTGVLLVGKDDADIPHDGVGFIDVIAGDFYGTGHTGAGSTTDFLVDGRWL
jgi:hypothetical protein